MSAKIASKAQEQDHEDTTPDEGSRESAAECSDPAGDQS